MNSTVAPRQTRSTDPSHSALGRLSRWCYRHRKIVVVSWIAALVVVFMIGQSAGGAFTDKFDGGHTESGRAQRLLQHEFKSQAGDSAQVVFKTKANVRDPAVKTAITGVLDKLSNQPHVDSIRSPYTPEGAGQLSRKGHIAYGTIQFDDQTADLPTDSLKKLVDTAQSATDKAASSATGSKLGLQVELGGAPISKAEPQSMGATEAIGILAAIIILLIAFGSLIAMGLPVVTALTGIGIGVGVIELLSHILTIPTFGTQLASMIAIGVGIDYALFIVTRYRQGIHEGRHPEDATVVALATAGRAVVFAGSTVVISLLGMFLLNASFIYGLAIGSIAAVLLVLGASLTLLPALLGFVGHKIDSLHVPGLLHRPESNKRTIWWRWSRVIQRRPWVTGGVALAVLVLLAVPLFAMRMAFTDQGNDPTNLTTRKAYDLLAQGFGAGANGPLVVAVNGHGSSAAPAANRVAGALQKTSGVAFVVPPRLNADKTVAVVTAIPTTSPQAKETVSLVHHLRSDVIPPAVQGTHAEALVGGQTAGSVDASTSMSARLPWVIGGVVVLSFLLLMAVFRSVAVPLKAAVMNLLSIGAAYGVIVAVFQWGWFGSVIGIGKTGPIEPWVPLFLFTILFGLSMDYEVFLLSRIREEWMRTGDNGMAVADGLATTARVITAAAAIMVCVFGSFILGDLRVLKLFGLGLATAVFVDATLVRMVLVPSTMEILGNANWWLPRWLDRSVPELSVEVDVPAPPAPRPVAEPEPAPIPEPVG